MHGLCVTGVKVKTSELQNVSTFCLLRLQTFFRGQLGEDFRFQEQSLLQQKYDCSEMMLVGSDFSQRTCSNSM